MKVLFTADIHIKLGQKNVPVDWSIARYRLLFQNLRTLSSKVDLTILGGDVFDKLPSLEELQLYYEMVGLLDSEKVILYSGNHEAIKKDSTFLSYLKFSTSKVNSRVLIIDDYHTYQGIDFIPYNRLKQWAKNPSEFVSQHGRVLATHVRGAIPPHVKPEIDLDLFNSWQVVLAGDLHSYENSQGNILYPGSPVTTSFHRNRVDTGVIIFDTHTLEHEWVNLDLPQLIRKTITAGEAMPATDYDHTVYDLEGDMSELAAVENTELLGKKIVQRAIDTSLILTPGMTLADELCEYLRYILQLDEATIDSVLREFGDYHDSD